MDERLLESLEDANLRFPSRPRMADDLRVSRLPHGLGVQVHGGELPVLLRGPHAEEALSFLTERMDGTRTARELLAAAPPELPAAAVASALMILHTKGLLVAAEHDPGPAAQTDAPSPLARQLLFWGRNLGILRNARSSAEAQQRLSSSRILLVGGGMFGAVTHDLLARSGCEHIDVVDWDDDGCMIDAVRCGPTPPRRAAHLSEPSVDAVARQIEEWSVDADLLVTATRNAPAALFHAVNRICLDRQLPWIHGNTSGGDAEVGPYVMPYASGCYTCMRLRQASADPHAVESALEEQSLTAPRPAGQTPPLGEAIVPATLAASLLSMEVLRILTVLAKPTLLNASLLIAPLAGEAHHNHFLRVPRCPDCRRPARLRRAEGGAHAG